MTKVVRLSLIHIWEREREREREREDVTWSYILIYTLYNTYLNFPPPATENVDKPVSYTHLDVYKRQLVARLTNSTIIQ